MNLEDTIDCFTTPIMVTRFNKSTTITNGLAQVVTDTDTFPLNRVSLQPVTGRDRKLLPENTRDGEVIKMYTPCELRGVNVKSKVKADQLKYNGFNYTVMNVENWIALGGYYKVLAVKINE